MFCNGIFLKKIVVGLLFSFFAVSCNARLHGDFQKDHPKSAENKKTLIGLYKKYLDKQPEDTIARDYLKESLRDFKDLIGDLDIELSLDEIKDRFDKYGVIQFREMDEHCRKLLIGCGNKPMSDDAGYIINKNSEYRKEHAHDGMITIDPDFAKNPTIVAYFGIEKLDIFENDRFDEVYIEGVYISCQKVGLEEIERILITSGKVFPDVSGGCAEGTKGFTFGLADLFINEKKFECLFDKMLEKFGYGTLETLCDDYESLDLLYDIREKRKEDRNFSEDEIDFVIEIAKKLKLVGDKETVDEYYDRLEEFSSDEEYEGEYEGSYKVIHVD